MMMSFLFFALVTANDTSSPPARSSSSTSTSSTTSSGTTTSSITSSTTTSSTTTLNNEWNVQCSGAGQYFCSADQQAWGKCSCDGSSLKCVGAKAADCLPGTSSMYDCSCINGPPPKQCTEEYNMGCAPGGKPCCANLECQTAGAKTGQCMATNPDAPSTNPYQPQQIDAQGWNVGCTSKISQKNGMSQFLYVKSDSLVDGKKVDIKQFIKGADGAKDLQFGLCTKECKADSDCPTIAGTTNKCLQIGSAKVCAPTEKCPSGMVLGVGLQICVSPNPFHYGANKLNYHTYFPVPNHWHDGYHSQQWDLSKNTADYLPLWLSNWNAGILLGHMLEQKHSWPLKKSQTKEYVYGTLFGQLFQESAPSTNPQDIKNNIINPMKTLLNVGQGGPYQLNDYSKQLPPNIDGAFGVLNYNALYHSLGYTVEEQNSTGPNSQTNKKGPQILNSVDQGPVVAAYFHFNDMNRMNVIMSQSYNAKKPAAQDWVKCIKNIQAGTFDAPDYVLNVIYNAGPYNSFAYMVFNLCANVEKYPSQMKDLLDYSLDDDEFVAKFDAFENKPVAGTSYILYPRQIRYNVDQMSNNNESMYEKSGAFSDTNITFTFQDVVDQFTKSMTGLGYKDKSDEYRLIDAAFLSSSQPSADLKKQFSFAIPADRETYYSFVEEWISAMEKAQGFYFSDATECNQTVGKKIVSSCAPPTPTCIGLPPTWDHLCTCLEDKATKEMKMHCDSAEDEKQLKDTYHCTCQKSTGTTTKAPTPTKGEACTAQNCAKGLACLAQIWAGGAEVWSEFRYVAEKPTCQPYDQDPMIEHLISQQNGSTADGKSCTASKDCCKDSVCVADVWLGSGIQADAECRAVDQDCKCTKAAESTDLLVKEYLSNKQILLV